MKNLKTQIVLIICTILIGLNMSACTFSRTYVNRTEDIKKGKQFVNDFYDNISNRTYDALNLMASDTLSYIAGKSAISEVAKLVNRKVGNYEHFSIIDSNTTRTEGSNNKIIYRFKIRVAYQHGIIDEMIGLEKIENFDIKVISYNVYSDLLIH